jgi:spore maturation protein B
MEQVRQVLDIISAFVLPTLIVGFVVYGLIKRVRVYEVFVEGAKEGFGVAVTIIPYLVAILFAIAMFRASGAMDVLINLTRPALEAIGFPPEVLPMAIVRPLTGGGSAAVLLEMKTQYGADSLFTRIAATIYGSSETTFYVIAVYFGAVNIRKTRHAVPAGLIADVAATILAVYVVKLLLG